MTVALRFSALEALRDALYKYTTTTTTTTTTTWNYISSSQCCFSQYYAVVRLHTIS